VGSNDYSIKTGSLGTTSSSAMVATGRYGDFDGLTILYEPRDIPSADLVFIHNLGGGSIRSWSDESRIDSLWPLQWLSGDDAVRTARICTYGYNSHLSATDPGVLLDITSYAKDLLSKLRFGLGRDNRSLDIGCAPLIFVGHSLGGLIAKKAYLLANANHTYRLIAEATCAFVFFSTPHRNITPNILNGIIEACIPGWDTARYGAVTEAHIPAIEGINEGFRSLVSLLDICSCYTQSVHDFGGQFAQFVLPRHLATLGVANEHQLSLRENLIQTVKFDSPSDSDYDCVRLAFQSLVDKHGVPRRFLALEGSTGQMREVQQLLGGCAAPQDDLSFFSNKRVSNSCEWIFNHPTMLAFLENKDPQTHVLWCFGNPGSGKSVTATHLIESLLEDARPCAYYYFRSGNPIKNNLGQFLSSIAYQISQQVPTYRRRLASLAAEGFDASKASHKLLWKKLLISALAQCDWEEPVFVVVDGLDELEQVKDLLQKMFVDLGDIPVPLRLLLVSRPTLDIEVSIERLSRRMLVQRLSLSNNADDLQMYVRDEMETMMGEVDFKEKTMSELLCKANGNFLWAHLVVREILQCQTEGQVEAALQEVPKELEDLYIRMASRLADLSRSRPHDSRMGHTIMMWAACARRPLHVKEIQTALDNGHAPGHTAPLWRVCSR
jgi:pimeloyl-ACP methyl ester carboxylesterase